MVRARDVEVDIYYLPTEHGGRRQPCGCGYRPQFYYQGRHWDALHEYPDVEAVAPGTRARAFLTFLSPQEHWGRVFPGMPFLIYEGWKVVGYGVVQAIVDLEASAAGSMREISGTRVFEDRRAFLRHLFAIRWSSFETAYGSVRWVPWWLAGFRFAPRRLALRAGHRLWCLLCHQHAYVSSAALPAAPFIIDVLGRRHPRIEAEALDIMLDFLRGTDPSMAGSTVWHSELRALVLGSVPTVEGLARSADPAVADLARSFLSEAGAAAA